MTKNKGSQRRKIMKVALIASDNNASSGAFLSMTNLAIQLNQLHVKTIVIIPPILFHVKKQKMPKHRQLLQPDADIFSKSGTHRKMEKVLLINQETL